MESAENREQRKMLVVYQEKSEQLTYEFEKKDQVIFELNEALEQFRNRDKTK